MQTPKKKKVNNNLIDLAIYTFILILLLLSFVNLSNFFSRQWVLGVSTSNTETQTTSDDSGFWKTFLEDHPDYLPGWVEIGEQTKADSIDPNYITP